MELGASVNARTVPGNFTPLHYAAMNGHRDTAIRLIHLGADVRAITAFGHTPAQVAQQRSDIYVYR